MTRTDVMASSRPRTAGAAPTRRGSAGLRRLSLLSVMLLAALALMAPGAAVAASTTGYSQTPTVTEPKPSTGTSPSKESSSPKTSTSPSKATEPSSAATAPEAQKASTLPFTGFDLRWSVGAGLLLMGAGFSIMVMQRRRREQ